MEGKFVLEMIKGTDSVKIKCDDKEQYNKLVDRYKRRGYKQIISV